MFPVQSATSKLKPNPRLDVKLRRNQFSSILALNKFALQYLDVPIRATSDGSDLLNKIITHNDAAA